MSETRLTPARRAELGALCGPGIKGRGLTRIHARSRALPEALAEVDRLTARWEALKVNIDAPAVVCSFRGDAYEQALLDVVREMARLEQEP